MYAKLIYHRDTEHRDNPQDADVPISEIKIMIF